MSGSCTVELVEASECKHAARHNLVASGDIMTLPEKITDNGFCHINIMNNAADKAMGTYSTPPQAESMLDEWYYDYGNTPTRDIWEKATEMAFGTDQSRGGFDNGNYVRGDTISTEFNDIFPEAKSERNKDTWDFIFTAKGGPRYKSDFFFMGNDGGCTIKAALKLQLCSSCNCAKGLIDYNTKTWLTQDIKDNAECRLWFVRAADAFLMFFTGLRNRLLYKKMKYCTASPPAAQGSAHIH